MIDKYNSYLEYKSFFQILDLAYIFEIVYSNLKGELDTSTAGKLKGEL